MVAAAIEPLEPVAAESLPRTGARKKLTSRLAVTVSVSLATFVEDTSALVISVLTRAFRPAQLLAFAVAAAGSAGRLRAPASAAASTAFWI